MFYDSTKVYTIKSHFKALGLYNIVSGFGRMRYNVHVSEKQIKPGPAKQFRVGMAKIGLSAKGMRGPRACCPRKIFNLTSLKCTFGA